MCYLLSYWNIWEIENYRNSNHSCNNLTISGGLEYGTIPYAHDFQLFLKIFGIFCLFRATKREKQNGMGKEKERVKMNKKLFFVFGFLLVGLLGMNFSLKDVYAVEGPVISASFAPKEFRPGDTLKVYLKASSLDSNMKAIYVTVEQAGGGVYPVSITRIKGDQQKELSGYLYWSTMTTVGSSSDFVPLKLIVQIQDNKGRFSEPIVLPVNFRPRVLPENPPAGMFSEKELGPIMIRLRPILDGGGDGSSFE